MDTFLVGFPVTSESMLTGHVIFNRENLQAKDNTDNNDEILTSPELEIV